MNKQCKQCGNEYGAERSTSKYCSSKCRKLAFQGTHENVKVGTLTHNFNAGTISPPERTAQGNVRVSKPGDDDYVP